MSMSVAVTLALCLLPGFFELAGSTNELGLQFLEDNKDRPGVVTLPSGLQYKVLINGTGDDHPFVDPGAMCSVECRYAWTTPVLTPRAIHLREEEWKLIWLDPAHRGAGQIAFATGAPNQLAETMTMPGWKEALKWMVEGDKWELYLPSDLGLGDIQTHSKVEAGSVLIFRLEVIRITGDKLAKKTEDREDGDRAECDWETFVGCSEKEANYVNKYKQGIRTPEERFAEKSRLQGLWEGAADLKEEQQHWIATRFMLLKSMVLRDASIKQLEEEGSKIRQEVFLKKMEGKTLVQLRKELLQLENMQKRKKGVVDMQVKDWILWRMNWLKSALGETSDEL